MNQTLDKGSGPKCDKIVILCDALKALRHLREEVAQMIEGNAALTDENKGLRVRRVRAMCCGADLSLAVLMRTTHTFLVSRVQI